MWITSSGAFASLTVWFLFTLLHVRSTIAFTTKYEWTYFKAEVNWNSAYKECKARNSRLIKLDTKLKVTMVEYFKEQWKNSNVLHTDYWIGMFDSNAPKIEYSWSDCSKVGNSSYNWYESGGEPDNQAIEFCVRSRRDNGLWRTKQCYSRFQFICEKELGACRFDKIKNVHIPPSGSGYTTDTVASDTDTDCEMKCKVDVNIPDEVCWAVTYVSSSLTCFMHKGPSPVPFLSQNNVQSTSVSFIRTCFEATSDESNVQEVPVIDGKPNGCLQLASATETVTSTTNIDETSTLPLFETTTQTKNEISSRSQDDVITPPVSSTTPPRDDFTTTMTVTSAESDWSSPGTEASSRAGSHEDCLCPCHVALTREESEVFIANILESLDLNKANVSSFRRKYISIPDARVSAQSIGYSGTVILVVVFGGLILLDLQRLLTDFKLLFKRLRDI